MGDKRKMNKEELTEKAQELTIKNVTNGESKYYSWGFYNGCVVGLEYNNNRIANLEKENAELKKKVENLQKYLDTRNCYRECAETWLKLTEAKKLLKQFLEAKNGEDTYKAEWEAEQFLNEVEK